MKRLAFFFFSFFIITSFVSSDFFTFADKNYVGGSHQFLTEVYQKIHYPFRARVNGVTGVCRTRVYVNPAGKVDSIQFRNNMFDEIQNEVGRVLHTMNNWIPADTTRVFDFSVKFRLRGLNQSPKALSMPEGGAVIIASAPNDMKSDEELLNITIKWIKKEKYNKAKKSCRVLIMRHPDSEHYQNIYMCLS